MVMTEWWRLIGKIVLLTLVLCFACAKSAQASIECLTDTIVDSRREKSAVKFFFALDARRSFVLENNSKFNGLKLGVTFKEKHRFGVGFYGMQQPVRFVADVDKDSYPTASDTVRFNFSYVSGFYEYVWLKNKRWELSTPAHLGLGNLSFSYMDTASVYRPLFSGGALMTEFTGVAQYKVFRWFTVGTGAGYRMMLLSEKSIRQSLNSPVYLIQFKILFGELYKMTFRRKELEKW
jgi:hypothetical protein